MTADGLKFGTSGLRGLVTDLTDAACAAYVSAFLRHMRTTEALLPGGRVLVGQDLRASSPRLALACLDAMAAMGFEAIDCGAVPTPALALAALEDGAAAIMVTGSHIPDDRNGLKFYGPAGEITKADEAGILALLSPSPDSPPTPRGRHEHRDVLGRYMARYTDFFAPGALSGRRVGVYQHSSVARDLLVDIIAALGGEPVPLGRAQSFVPLDTEAVHADVVAALRRWAGDHRLDAIVSTDGDADRPLVADEDGMLVRGDMLGLLSGRFLGARIVVTPVTSLSAIETEGGFGRVVRTRVGSPHVIAEMAAGDTDGATVIGFEANGGLLLGSSVERMGRRLAPLPTRDAMLPILAVLTMASELGVKLSDLVTQVQTVHGASGRLENVPVPAARTLLERLADPDHAARLLSSMGQVVALDAVDGLRFTLDNGRIVHYRASGNAPELRCYTQAPTRAAAETLLVEGLDVARRELFAR